MKKGKFCLIFALAFFLGNHFLTGQIFDNRGREFWITFLPNFHNNKFSSDPLFRFSDSLYIFIASDKPTRGTIEYYDLLQNRFTRDFTINDPSVIYTFKLAFNNYELLGYNDMGAEWRQNFDETVSHLSFHIQAESDVTVYAHSQGNKSSDAFLVLPTKALGNEYYVMSYKSDGRFASIMARTPSQFAIVATEDSTLVRIKPSAPTFSNDTVSQVINLNKGDVYLVQARILTNEVENDLTGSHIIANKPVAVFAGHQRATLPLEIFEPGSNPSRDFICEQLPPLQVWGKNAFIIPFPQPQIITRSGMDIFRVLAGYDSTHLFIDGNYVATLQRGQFYQDSIYENQPRFITANKPILAAQFKKTSNTSGASWLGDPFMMIVPPKEQFIDSCLLVNIQAYEIQEDRSFTKVYQEHYLTLVVPQSAISNTKIDGALVPTNNFRQIPASGYYYANVKVSEGQHFVQSSEPIGIYAYGYGPANSYGYIGGMATRYFDFNPPKISFEIDCFKANVTITDTAVFDSGIDTIYYDATQARNIIFYPDSTFAKYNKFAKLSFELINPFFDGTFTIFARDSFGLTSNQAITIEGFTASYPNQTPNVFKVLPLNFIPNVKNTYKLPVQNYGNHPVEIEIITITTNLNFKLETQLPITINANSIDTLVFSMEDNPTRNDSVVIQIGNRCIMENYAILRFSETECDPTEFEYSDFLQPYNLNLVGSARIINNYIQLTPPSVNRSGAIWHTQLVPVVSGFTCEFSFRMQNGSNNNCRDNSVPGADGLAFLVQNFIPFAIGNYGGGIGYDGIPNSLAIEFDTFSNDSTQIENFFDPNGNHIAVQSGGSRENSSRHKSPFLIAINPNLPITLIPDGRIYYTKISYSLKEQKLMVYLDTTANYGQPVLVLNNFELHQVIPLERGYRAYVGLTAATGCAFETHEILNWSFCPTPPDPTLEVTTNETLTNTYVFPNPTDGKIFLAVEWENLPARIRITDLFGNELVTKQVAENLTELDISNFAPGAYIISIYGERFVKSFFINLLK